MSLKSGLLAESTWAIDALNILLYDDSTIAYFHLKHFPGLLNILIEHFLKCLKLIFNENEFSDLFMNDYLLNQQDDNNDDEIDQINNDNVVYENEAIDEINKKKHNNHNHLNGYSNHNDHNEESSSSSSSSLSSSKIKQLNNSIDNYKILKINFNDKITRKRFLHYYKSVKYNDSKCCLESFDYNNKLLAKYQQKSESNENNQSSNVASNKKHELNNYILTSFNSNDDLETLNKLFYGTKFYEQTQELKNNSSSNEEIKHKNKKIKTTDYNHQEYNNNSKFIKLHQEFSVSNCNGIEPQNAKFYEDQPLQSDEEQLFKLNNQKNNELISRCTSISTIFRNLSFVPGNDVELCKNNVFLKILARLLVFKHKHKIVINNKNSENGIHDEEEKEQDTDEEYLEDDDDDHHFDEEFKCIKELIKKNLFYQSSKKTSKKDNQNDFEWWSECVQLLRENTLVTIANISASLNLNNLDEDVIELYSHGLFHWSICKSQDAQDSMSTTSDTSLLSAQRLAIESLSKMTINEINIDLVLTTMSRMQPYVDSLINVLCGEWLIRRDDEINREFSIVLATSLAKCDQFACRSIAKYSSFLISFIEDFEEIARVNRLVYSNLQFQQLQNDSNINEENLGTTVDMLRRCSNCLLYLSAYNENIPFIIKHENRLLFLITSPFVDFKVCQTLTEVLYSCSTSFNTSTSIKTTTSTESFKYSFLDPTIQTNLK